jgi:GNAT superfamily N-acetyltransferase
MGGANHLAQFFCRTMSLRVEGEAISPNSRWRYELINFMSNNFIIRDYRAEDFDSVTSLWRISREKSLPDFQLEKGHFFYEDCNYFRQNVLMENQIWVVDVASHPVAFMAMNMDFIDQLYIHPDHWRRGIGETLINFAKARSPEHLWLYTLQVNVNARAFYEKNGFIAEKFGISPPPESEPDMEYHWRPDR